MPEVHLPKLDDQEEQSAPAVPTATHPRRGKSLVTIAVEVILISGGVFLGLMGEQWRDHAHQRERAAASLRRFRTEILNNRKAVDAVKDYHATLKKQLEEYFSSDKRTDVVMTRGVAPIFFEQAAWDLALATQSLAYIEPELAFALSRAYTIQKSYAGIETAIVQSTIYGRPINQDTDGHLRSILAYLGDVSIFDPALRQAYDEVLPQIDRALGE